MTDERLAYRGFVGHVTLVDVGFAGAYDLECHFLFHLNVKDSNDIADSDLLGGDLVVVEDYRMCESLLDLCDTGLDKTLLVLCLIVLTVLGKVAEGTCQLYLLGNFGADYGFEILDRKSTRLNSSHSH